MKTIIQRVNAQWPPHITVATVIEQDDKFLLVYENDNGKQVYNQPAGHWEQGESLFAAAIRETLEETALDIELTAFIGNYIYQSPVNGVVYHRSAFSGRVIANTAHALDPEIIDVVWLSYDEIRAKQHQVRSPLVLQVIDDYRSGQSYPLEMIKHVG